METLIARIKELRMKKQKFVFLQNYEGASKLRDTEKGLLEELSKHHYFEDQYELYLESKKEEFEKLLTEKDGFYSGAKKAATSMPNARFVSFPGLNHVQVTLHPDLFPHLKNFLVNKNS